MVWKIMLLTAVFFALLYAFCMRVRVGSRVFEALRRGVSSVWALVILSLVPGMTLGLNAFNILMLSLLGAPGAVLLQVIAFMP